MDPVFQSALSMDVPIITIVTAARNFSMNAVLPIGNVKFDVVATVYVMKVAIFLRMLVFYGYGFATLGSFKFQAFWSGKSGPVQPCTT